MRTARNVPSHRTPLAPVDLSILEVRKRLSPGAVKAFMNLVDTWSISVEDARHLLGGVSNGQYYEYRKNPHKTLGQDTLTRISLLIGIFKSLNILHGAPLADAWITLKNTNRIFGGSSPLEYMIRGGVPAILNVRRLLDARRGGVA